MARFPVGGAVLLLADACHSNDHVGSACCARQMRASGGRGMIFDTTFDKWSFARRIRTNVRELAHDGDLFAAAGGVVFNQDIRKEALARIGR